MVPRYRRIFSIGTHAVTTYNPQNLEITNQVGRFFCLFYVQWVYNDFVSIRPAQRQANSDGRQGEEFVILVRKNGKSDTMRFSSEFTQEILSQALVFQDHFSEKPIGKRVSNFATCVRLY